MEDQTRRIIEFYNTACEEDARLSGSRGKSRTIEYLTTMRYLKKYCAKDKTVLDACAGTGIYSFPLAEVGCRVTAGDLTPKHVELIRRRQKENPVLGSVYEGSILDLSRFPDESFDVVLNLGSYYHLNAAHDRAQSVRECLRVLKKGGILYVAYVNKFSVIIRYHSEWLDDFDVFERYIETGHRE